MVRTEGPTDGKRNGVNSEWSHGVVRHKRHSVYMWEGWTETYPDFSGERSKGRALQGNRSSA